MRTERKNFDVNLKENVERKGELLGLIDSLFRGNPEVALFYFSGHGYIKKCNEPRIYRRIYKKERKGL